MDSNESTAEQPQGQGSVVTAENLGAYADALDSGSWRELLHAHAQACWDGGGQQISPPAAVTDALARQLGPDRAADSLALIEQIVRGHEGATNAPFPVMLARQLGIVLDGLSSVPIRRLTSPRAIFQSELWQMLHDIRESADISYSRTIQFNELDRRILLLIQSRRQMTPAELSATSGVDKAQVSRSVKRLEQSGLTSRDSIRSPLRLTADGVRVTDRLMRLAALRNRELTFGVSDAELNRFFTLIEAVMVRAVTLYETERNRVAGMDFELGPKEVEPIVPRSAIGDALVIDRSRIVPPLIALNAYVMRGAALAFKRVTGLSNFESWVLNEIAADPPINWGDLARAVQRDHSQAGRTVNHLIDLGLVRREGEPGRRHGLFSPTPAGRTAHLAIMDAAAQRADYLMEAIPEADRAGFLATFDKIWHNARAQVERERAAEELRQG